jgi:hypothetical protein
VRERGEPSVVEARERYAVVESLEIERNEHLGSAGTGAAYGPSFATLALRTAHSSSGLGHRPLTAAARVRIPYGPYLKKRL